MTDRRHFKRGAWFHRTFNVLQKLTPVPQQWKRHPGVFNFTENRGVLVPPDMGPAWDAAWDIFADDCQRLQQWKPVPGSDTDQPVCLELMIADKPIIPKGGYCLKVRQDNISLFANTIDGIRHGLMTLSQLMAIHQGESIDCCEILDWPHYEYRWIMLDPGRAPFSLSYLRRIVRIACRLKYNGLHLHLNDNQLNAVRYEGTPLGSENPFALTMQEYEKLVQEARLLGIEIIAEIESWGHVGSILQHYPHLYGASRRSRMSHSFAMGPEAYDLLGNLYSQWINILPTGSKLHVGLDEANWWLADGADPEIYNEQTLVRQIYNMIQDRAEKYHKDIQMVMWGGGRPHSNVFIPGDIRDQIILEPWHYKSAAGAKGQVDGVRLRPEDEYRDDGNIRAPFICGGGVSSIHELGALEATSTFAKEARRMPNCLGLSVCLWCTNDLNSRMVSIYHGADCAWNPQGAEDALGSQVSQEISYSRLARQMKMWQRYFPEADPEGIAKDRGPEILMGVYRWGDKAGQWLLPEWKPDEVRFVK